MCREIVIWDREGKPPDREGYLLWRGHGDCGGARSLLKIVEEESDGLRERYFEVRREFLEKIWEAIAPLSFGGEMQKRLLWMSLTVESSTMISPLLSVLRLLAVERLLEKESKKPSKIRYEGDDSEIAVAVELLAKKRGILFDGKLGKKKWLSSWIGNGMEYCWGWGGFLRMVMRVVRYAREKPVRWVDGEKAIFFVSYFTNIDGCAAKEKRYDSRYWGKLPELLRELGKCCNWLQLPVVGTGPDVQGAQSWLRGFNERVSENGRHAFLDSFFSWKSVGKICVWYFLQPFFYRRWAGKAERAIQKTEDGWLWSLLGVDFQRSFLGRMAVQHLFVWDLFDAAMRSLPKQAVGVFLCENVGWERAFIAAWRKYGHGTIIGVAHATVRYWDLRYFSEKGLEKILGFQDFPKVDRLAVNGKAAVEMLRGAGYPMKKVVEVEALRYLYLGKPRVERVSREGKRCLLVFGDIVIGTTERLLHSVVEVMGELEQRYEIFVKPHPANRINYETFPEFRNRTVDGSMEEVLGKADLALASVYTSSGLDAVCSGVRTAIFLDPEECNFSPLRSVAGIEFFSSGTELLESVNRLEQMNVAELRVEDYFWVDEELPRWRRLLTDGGRSKKGEG